MDPRLSQALEGRYRVERELGVGGGGRVFLAQDLRHDRRVAIKVLDPHLASAISPERFLREIRISARMMHPHILPLFDSGTTDGLTWFAMAYASGGTLRDRLRAETQLAIDESVRIASALAEALDSAHRQGVAHRDVKPENVLFEDGHPMLADFGIARALAGADAPTMTIPTHAIGTPGYMSPEQIAAEPDVAGATDQYSLACVLFEMLGGRPPFPGSTRSSILQQHLSAPPPSVRDLRPTVPAALSAAIQKALAKAPADRFPDVLAFRDAMVAGAAETGPARPRARARLLIAAPVVILAAVVLLVVHPWRGATPKTIRSLAVLPLSNVSGDPKEEYFADGMTEELILELSKISALRVISRTSVMSLKNAGLPLSEIGRRLGVDAVLEGTIAREGDRLRVNLRLFRVRPERQLWGQRYDRPATGVFALQTEIARAVTRPVEVEMTPAEHARLAPRHAVPAAAHEAYLRGRFALATFDAAHMRLALQEFNAAIAADPQYADAWANLAQTYYLMSNVFLPPRSAMERARSAARQALALDPQLASAHTMLGATLAQYDWKFDEAEVEYRAALALDPSDSDCHFYLGYLMLELGRLADSEKEFDAAHELDPLNTYKSAFAAYVCYCDRRFAEAEQKYRDLLASNPDDEVARYSLALVALAEGHTDDAIRRLESMSETTETSYPLALLGYAYGRAGRRSDAERVLARLTARGKERQQPTTVFALVHVGLGNEERALEWIARAIDERDENLLTAGVDPVWDPIRHDERFRSLIRRIGISAT
jgi:serine/threonine-protein kinase